MADDQERAPDWIPGLAQDFVAQLRGTVDRLESLTGIGEHIPSALSALSPSSLRNLPKPGALSAAQVSSISSGLTAQRRSIQALQAQLTSFDEQLAVLERLLGPLAEWSKAWADLEERLLKLARAPGTGSQAGGS